MDGGVVRWMSVVLLLAIITFEIPRPSLGLNKPSGVKLQNNEYTGIVVAIHPDEPENPEIIDIIKEMFVNASSYLYNATKKRAFFKEVTILVPQTWSDNPTYGSPGNATFNGADVIVAAHNPRFAPDGSNSALPYTKQFAGCGEQSLYIHLTSQFLLDYRYIQWRIGNYGRVLVHEWGHYRWGLFNEYTDERIDLQDADYFYYSETNLQWEPSSCPTGWFLQFLKQVEDAPGKYRLCNGNPSDGYEKGCFSEAISVQPRITGSIMQSVVQDEVVNFCDNDADDQSYLHNSEAPSKQNKLCDGKSSWEVMREHPDFNGYTNNPPREIDDVTPTFHVVRARVLRTVLVLDTSGSMSTSDRHLTLADAARTYITSILPDGSFVGLVDFDDDGLVLSELTEITSVEVRRRLADLVPVNAEGGTCIGCGMSTAMEILKRYDPDVGGSRVILITDGEDQNVEQRITMKRNFIENKVIIDSIAIAESASEDIRDLADQTGGNFYLQTDNSDSTGIRDAFSELYASGGTREHDRRIELQSTVASFHVGKTDFRKSVYIDSTLGRSTVFDFSYFTTDIGIDVRLISPSAAIIDRSSPEYQNDQQFKKVVIEISDIAEPGSWEYIISNRVTSEDHDVQISVSSYPSKEGVDPILVDSYLSSSESDLDNNKPLVAYAEVRQGFYPVVNATVIAIIETPTGTTVQLPLLDNGAGADVTKADGIYSRFFTQFTGTGYYGFKLQVDNQGDAKVLTPGSWKYSGIKTYYDPDILLAGNISVYGNDTRALPGGPIPDLVGEPAPKFTRGVSGGASSVPELPDGWAPDVDSIPPSKITDLVVSNTSYEDGLVYVRFTAPGDDLDFGTVVSLYLQHIVTSYAWSNSSIGLRKQLEFYHEITEDDVIYGNISSPAAFGEVESIALRLSFPKDAVTVSYLIGVFAIDEADNAALMSNIAQAAFRKYIPPSLEEMDLSTTEDITTDETMTTSVKTVKDKSGVNYQRSRRGVVIGGTGCVIFITIFVVVLANVVRSRQRRTRYIQSEYVAVDPANENMLAKV